jgi:hypothetical protein
MHVVGRKHQRKWPVRRPRFREEYLTGIDCGLNSFVLSEAVVPGQCSAER